MKEAEAAGEEYDPENVPNPKRERNYEARDSEEVSNKFTFKKREGFKNTKKKTGMKFKELNKTEAELKQDARDVQMMKDDMERSEKEAKRKEEWLAKKAA